MRIFASKTRQKEASTGILLLFPGFIMILLVLGYPLLSAIWLSLNRLYLLKSTQPEFAGLENFQKFFQDANFFLYMKNTGIWLCGTVLGLFLLGMIAALLLNGKMKFRPFYRGLALTPWVMPPVVVGLVWRWILDGQWGVLNFLLIKIGILKQPVIWLSDTRFVWLSVLMVALWKFFPFWYVNLLAGLQMIPMELYESAKIDGANARKAFLFITMPMLRPVLFVLFILQTIWSANEFTIIWVMTQAGPGNFTMTLAPLIYVTSFRYYRMGYGASIGVLLMVFMLLFTAVYLRRVKSDI